jgi:hypothetical protein
MHDLTTLNIFGSDLGADGGWRLVEWCRLHGANEFTVSQLSVEGRPTTAIELFERAARPFQQPSASRRHLEAAPGEDLVRATDLWLLTDDTISTLRSGFPLGLFHYDPRPGAWLEDLILYRGSELMLGVITHEQEGVVRLSPTERKELDVTGLRYRLEGQWVGY